MGDSLPMLMRQAKGLKRKDGIIMKVFDEMDLMTLEERHEVVL